MAVEETTESAAPEVDQAILTEAKSQGWVEKEAYRGNPNDWVSAETFVERGRQILPILRKNNENLVKDLQHTKEQLKEFREAAEDFKKFQKESYERKAQEYEDRIASLKESRAQAISEGDGQRVNVLDDAIDAAKDSLKEAKQVAKEAATPPTPEPATNTIDPTLQTWLDRNDWFGKDRRMTSIVNGIGESIRLENPELKGQPFLDKLDEVLEEEFPGRFTKASKKASPVESGAGRQGRGSANAKSYDNLPAEAKSACDRFVKQKLMTKQEYVDSYDWS